MRRPAALTAALLLAAPAWAGSDGDFTPDPADTWRVITQDDATSTSRCIGQVDTPVCAVETLIACHMRGTPELCRIATGRTHDFSSGPLPNEWLRYRLTRASPIQPEDFARQHLGHFGVQRWKPGSMLVEMVEETCYGTFCEGSLEMIYILRRSGKGWHVYDSQLVVMD
jgi:hypothetical protein